MLYFQRSCFLSGLIDVLTLKGRMKFRLIRLPLKEMVGGGIFMEKYKGTLGHSGQI